MDAPLEAPHPLLAPDTLENLLQLHVEIRGRLLNRLIGNAMKTDRAYELGRSRETCQEADPPTQEISDSTPR
jgi:hypothetical protein